MHRLGRRSLIRQLQASTHDARRSGPTVHTQGRHTSVCTSGLRPPHSSGCAASAIGCIREQKGPCCSLVVSAERQQGFRGLSGWGQKPARACVHREACMVWREERARTLAPVAVDALAGVLEVDLHHLVLEPAPTPQPSPKQAHRRRKTPLRHLWYLACSVACSD